MTSCVVSAYYKIPSKCSHETYIPRLIRFFNSVKAVPVVFFTTADVVEELRNNINTDDVTFVYLPFEDFQAFNKFGVDFWVRQKERDPQLYHTYQLGAVWYEKKEFVLRAMDIIKTDIYIWCDAGCIRDQLSEDCAKSFGTRTTYSTNDDKIHLQQINDNITNDFYQFPYKCIAGAIIVGNNRAWREYSRLYDSTLTHYDSNQVSGTSDQYIVKSCVDSRPDLFVLYPQPSSIDNWFKFLEFM